MPQEAASHLTEHATEHAAEHGGDINDLIMHHITDQNSIELPWPIGEVQLPEIHIGALDISITKHVVIMWVVALLLVLLIIPSARRIRAIPSKWLNMIELFILFVRDEVAEGAMGKEWGRKLTPYLLTTFFFILLCNLFGLVPYGATVTGNISVTAALALCSAFMIELIGIKQHGFFGHYKNLVPHGLPALLVPIMIPIEIMGKLAKPFALCIRLFANMTAGHVVILALLGLIPIFADKFHSPVMGLVVSPVSVGFAVFVSLMEILIALIQAYIFTMLTALFIGLSIDPGH